MCRCICGTEKEIVLHSIIYGDTKSCGCHRKNILKIYNYKHGLYGSGEYVSWTAMHNRCYRKKDASYNNYGKKGIKVCDRWHKNTKNGFLNFVKDRGKRPNEYSIERKDSTKDYFTENCIWIPHGDQSKNTNKTIIIEYNNTKMCLSDWARFFNIPDTICCTSFSRYLI